MNPRHLVWILGIATAGAVAACFLALDRRSQAEQLIEILAGKSVPDAAWAFARLCEIGDEDLRVLARHMEDTRATPLELIVGWHSSGIGSKARLTVEELARHVLLSRTGAGELSVEQFLFGRGRRLDRQGWSNEVERFLLAHGRPNGLPVEPRPVKRSWLGSPSESPPSCPAGVFSKASPGSSERIVDALCGDDAARSIWFFETLRRAPDEALDGLVEQVLSPRRTKVCLFDGKTDLAKRSDGFALGRLIQLLLSERVGDGLLQYNAHRAAEYELPEEPTLAAMVEAAWRAYRTKGTSSK